MLLRQGVPLIIHVQRGEFQRSKQPQQLHSINQMLHALASSAAIAIYFKQSTLYISRKKETVRNWSSIGFERISRSLLPQFGSPNCHRCDTHSGIRLFFGLCWSYLSIASNCCERSIHSWAKWKTLKISEKEWSRYECWPIFAETVIYHFFYLPLSLVKISVLTIISFVASLVGGQRRHQKGI